ncbi:hypothetical protein [Kitasatospora indigofera]|uniref:hypothetical protein n=1 Tax=Kitasatospora indigofera TaxID=67307 RepID=UPI0036A1AB13
MSRVSVIVETAELESKVHGLETALAVQEANLAGAQASMSSTFAATHTGTWSVMVAGSVALVVGIFLGVAITKH